MTQSTPKPNPSVQDTGLAITANKLFLGHDFLLHPGLSSCVDVVGEKPLTILNPPLISRYTKVQCQLTTEGIPSMCQRQKLYQKKYQATYF